MSYHTQPVRIDRLETRRLFTAAWLDAAAGGGVLHVTGGDARNDVINVQLVQDPGDPARYRVRINARPYVSFPAADVDAIHVRGGGGNDFITVAGNSLLRPAQPTPITFLGGRGNDKFYTNGDLGDVLMRGNGGADWMQVVNGASSQADGSLRGRFDGGGGDDVIAGSAGDDLITGGGGGDFINAYGGNDTIFGGDERDVISGGSANDLVFGGAGDDSVEGDDQIPGDDALFGGDGDDDVQGWGGDDLILGNSGADELHGGSALLDSTDADDGIDRLYGGDGVDALDTSDPAADANYGGEHPNLTAILNDLRAGLPGDVQASVTA